METSTNRCISFPVSISDVPSWIEENFSGKEPFKLIKTSMRQSNDKEGFIVRAVSLIDGSKYFFEIYEDVICIYFIEED